MSTSSKSSNKKRIIEMIIFLAAMAASFFIIFHGQDLSKIFSSINKLSLVSLLESGIIAIFFVSAEGMMIFYLLHSLNGKSGLLRCISYSFIGFFYSGITPSATGGQPMQLYYMKKDGNSLADSSVVLMVVALIYKFVLVICGVFLLVFWNHSLRFYLQNYFGLYLFGLLLNIVLVFILFEIMIVPDIMKKIIIKAENLLGKLKIMRLSVEQQQKSIQFIDSYHSTVQFLKSHKRKIIVVIGMTFLQRCSVFFMTYIIYRGFGLQGADLFTIVFLQASIYIAVDMMPIPGAQGITELMYQSVFKMIFSKVYLISSLYVIRGINFYFLLIISIVVVILNWFQRGKNERFV